MSRQFGNYLEDFSVGKKFRHPVGKTITESDNNFFSLMTMNHHPLHIDTEYAKGQEFGKIVVVGTLVFSIAVGLTVQDISGKAIANLDYESIQHLQPVFIGDTINAETEILEVRESKSKPDRGIIHVETRVYNQKHENVLSFRRHVLIPKKNSSR